MLTLYKILTFLLMPVAVLLSFSVIPLVLMSLSNPGLLLGTFLYVCVVLYTFSSYWFMVKGLTQQQPLKKKLKDWIRVNAIPSLVIAVISFVSCAMILNNYAPMRQAMEQNMQAMIAQTGTQQITAAQLYAMLQRVSLFMFLYCAFLIAHIILSLLLIRKYRDLFVK